MVADPAPHPLGAVQRPTPTGATAFPGLVRQRLAPESPEAHHLLESLDDAMFAAIAGDVTALGSARELWRMAAVCLSPEQLDESREQYLRYALEVARRFETAEEIRDTGHAMIAVEILERLVR